MPRENAIDSRNSSEGDIDEPPFFDGDTILLGAVGLGVLGYIYGDPVIDWAVDTWGRWG